MTPQRLAAAPHATFTRTVDRSLQLTVQRILHQSPYQAIRKHVSVAVEGNTAVLLGRLPNFFMKQVAQETAARVAGVATVLNLTTVTD